MRFITEFEELRPDFIHRKPSDILVDAERDLGHFIAKHFGWQKPNAHHHRLEIEAFPMDKWVEFKEKLMDHFTNDATNRMLTSRLLEELESFGKPAGDAKELNL